MLHNTIVEHQLAELEAEACELQCRRATLKERHQTLQKLEESLDTRLKWHEVYTEEVSAEVKEAE